MLMAVDDEEVELLSDSLELERQRVLEVELSLLERQMSVKLQCLPFVNEAKTCGIAVMVATAAKPDDCGSESVRSEG